ncbi:MAG: hypothetical protein GC181_07105 [Bacteroidetes bacterium]|nr:hypothetical protein [Bacteroidota bacterium]
MQKIKQKALAVIAMLFAVPVFSQNVSVVTEYDAPEKNSWNGAMYIGGDFQPHTGGLMLGMYGRYTLGKIATISTNLAYDYTRLVSSGGLITYDQTLTDKLPAYKNFEFRGTFHLKDNMDGSLKTTIKLGRRVENAGVNKTRTIKFRTDHTTKARIVTGLTASLNIQSRFAGQPDSTQVFKVTDATGKDPGKVQEIFIAQNNVMIGVGMQIAQYTWFKGKFSAAAIGTKTRRVRKSIIANFELLYAMTIATGDEAYKVDKNNNNTLLTYKLNDVEKRRLGFRICTDYAANKPGLYQRMEIGYRPGVWAPSNGSKFLNQGYIVYGVGIGF